MFSDTCLFPFVRVIALIHLSRRRRQRRLAQHAAKQPPDQMTLACQHGEPAARWSATTRLLPRFPARSVKRGNGSQQKSPILRAFFLSVPLYPLFPSEMERPPAMIRAVLLVFPRSFHVLHRFKAQVWQVFFRSNASVFQTMNNLQNLLWGEKKHLQHLQLG
jgi:hypothetical protein